MSNLHLELADGKTKYRPGETIEGVAFWELPELPKVLELRLFWRTQGKGTVDHQIATTVAFDGAKATDRRPFRSGAPSRRRSGRSPRARRPWPRSRPGPRTGCR